MIGVGSEFVKNWITEHIAAVMEDQLSAILGRSVRLVISVDPSSPSRPPNRRHSGTSLSGSSTSSKIQFSHLILSTPTIFLRPIRFRQQTTLCFLHMSPISAFLPNPDWSKT